jgi:hypothetical protein
MFLTLLQSGGAGPPVIAGVLSAVEPGSDALAAEGVIRVSGALSAAEAGVDSLLSSGAVSVGGALSATETGSDTCVASGVLLDTITGVLAATETGADAMSCEGVVRVRGALAAAEAGDTLAAPGRVPVAGILAATEFGPDTCVATGDTLQNDGFTARVVRRDGPGYTATTRRTLIVSATPRQYTADNARLH